MDHLPHWSRIHFQINSFYDKHAMPTQKCIDRLWIIMYVTRAWFSRYVSPWYDLAGWWDVKKQLYISKYGVKMRHTNGQWIMSTFGCRSDTTFHPVDKCISLGTLPIFSLNPLPPPLPPPCPGLFPTVQGCQRRSYQKTATGHTESSLKSTVSPLHNMTRTDKKGTQVSEVLIPTENETKEL